MIKSNLIFAISLLAGMGLMFIGLRLISNHLRSLVGPHTKEYIGRILSGRSSPLLFGLIAGAVMQSVNAVAMLLAAFVSAGALSLKKSFSILGWANLGTSFLILVASLNTSVFAMVLLSATGIAYYFNLDQSAKYRDVLGAVLGISLLFLSIGLMKQSTHDAAEYQWLIDFTTLADNYKFLGIFIGALLAFLLHSSTTVTLIAMSVAHSGFVHPGNGAMIVIGAMLGSALSVWLLALKVQGRAKQIFAYQFFLKLCGFVGMFILVLIDAWSGGMLITALSNLAGRDAAVFISCIYVFGQIISDVVMYPAHNLFLNLIQILAPPSTAEQLGRAEHLAESALADPNAALVLTEKEQIRVIMRLPDYLDGERSGVNDIALSVRDRMEADRAILRRCDRFMEEIGKLTLSQLQLEKIILLRDRNELILALAETVVELINVDRPLATERTRNLDHAFYESLHMLLVLFAEASQQDGGIDNLSLLIELTADRSELIENIRQRVSIEVTSGDPAVHKLLMNQAVLFERAVWLIRRHARLLDRINDLA